MNWFEPLPKECPPIDAIATDGFTAYRIVAATPPSISDFHSQLMLAPNKVFKDIGECVAMSLSVFNDITACENVLRMPTFRGKQILKLELSSKDGVVLKTFKEHHYSWWCTQEFLEEITQG